MESGQHGQVLSYSRAFSGQASLLPSLTLALQPDPSQALSPQSFKVMPHNDTSASQAHWLWRFSHLIIFN